MRGAQTLAELRANAAALGGPAEADALNAVIADLGDRAAPLVVALPRAPGQAATRYAHTLCGAPSEAAVPVAEAMAAEPARGETLASLSARVVALETRLAALETALGTG